MAASRLSFFVALFTLTFEQTRPYETSVSDIFFILASIAAVPIFFTLRVPIPPRSAALPAGMLILAGGAFSLLNADLSDASLLPTIVKLVVTFGVLPLLVTLHGSSVKSAALVFAAGVAVNCGIAVLEAGGFGLRERLEINPVTEADLWGRHRGLASHSNILGISAALGSIVLASAFMSERKFARRAFMGAGLLACALAAALTTSRTALVTIPLIALLVLAEGKVRPSRLGAAGAILIVAVGLVAFLAPEYIETITERFASTGSENEGDNLRMESLQIAMSDIAQNPIVGSGVEKAGTAGLMYIPSANAKYLGTHNSPIQFWHAMGLLGVGGWLWMFAGILRRLMQARRVASSRQYINVHLAMLAVLFLAGNLHPFLFVRFFYVPVYLASAAAAWTLYEARRNGASISALK